MSKEEKNFLDCLSFSSLLDESSPQAFLFECFPDRAGVAREIAGGETPSCMDMLGDISEEDQLLFC